MCVCVCLIVPDVEMRRARHEFGCCAKERMLNVCYFLCHILQVADLKFLARKLDTSLRFVVLCVDPSGKCRDGM